MGITQMMLAICLLLVAGSKAQEVPAPGPEIGPLAPASAPTGASAPAGIAGACQKGLRLCNSMLLCSLRGLYNVLDITMHQNVGLEHC